MVDTKLSDLTETTALDSADEFYVNDSGNSRRITATNTADQLLNVNTENGIGISASTADGTLHVHTATAGSVTANASADDLVVESGGAGGISVLTPSASNSGIYFGSTEGNDAAFIEHLGDAGDLRIRTNSAKGTATVYIHSGNNGLAATFDANQRTNIYQQLNLINSGAIQDASTDVITFNGSQNVDIPNGTLTCFQGIDTNGSGSGNHLRHVVSDNSDTRIQDYADGSENTIGQLVLRNLDGAGAGTVELEGNNALNILSGGSNTITCDTSSNVDIANGVLSVASGASGETIDANTRFSVESGGETRVEIFSDVFNNDEASLQVGGTSQGIEISHNPIAIPNDVISSVASSLNLQASSSVNLRSNGGTIGLSVDTSQNVDVPNGELQEQGVRVGPIESGTWTPVLEGDSTAGSYTYTEQQGNYQRRGNIVWFNLELQVDTVSSAGTGSAQITGFPFSVNDDANQPVSTMMENWTSLPGDWAANDNAIFGAGANADTIVLFYNDTSGDHSAIQISDLGVNFRCRISGVIQVA